MLKSRKAILTLIQNEKSKLNISNLDESLKMMYEYVLKWFLDSKYYEKELDGIINISQNTTKDKINDSIKEEKSIFEEIISFKGEAIKKDLSDKKVKIIYQKLNIYDEEILFNIQITINEEIVVLASNFIYSKGQDLIAFYNIIKWK